MIAALFRLLAVGGGIAAYAILLNSYVLRFGVAAVPDKPGLGALAFGYLITVVGVVLGSAYRQLVALRARGIVDISNLYLFFGGVFHSVELWLGVFASPIVYSLIWKAFDGGSLKVLGALALENGFFCTAIMSSIAAPRLPSGSQYFDPDTKNKKDAARASDADPKAKADATQSAESDSKAKTDTPPVALK
jgi:hypothetical protein